MALLLLVPAAATALGVRIVSLQTRDLVYSRADHLLYASVPGSVPTYGNSIVAIDPATGEIGRSIFVGSEPGKLALADDGHTLYVALNGVAAVRMVDLQAGSAGLQFTLGSDSFFGPYYAEDMSVQPGHPEVLAVSLMNLGISPRHAGVAIFDSGVARPTRTQRHTGSNRIEFSSDPSRIYGLNNETTEFGFRRLQVTDAGVTELDVTYLFGGPPDMIYDHGRMYTTTGQVADPEARLLLGTFPFPSMSYGQTVAPDSSRAYYLTGGDYYGPITLYEFDAFTFTAILSQPVSGAQGSPGSLVRWGDDGLAFRTSQDQVLLLTRIHEPPTSDLAITQRDSADPVVTNSTFTYRVVVRNSGPSAAAGVTVRDHRPSGASLQYAYGSRGSTTDSSGTTVWKVGTLVVGDSATLSLSMYASTPGVLENEARASSDVLDPDPLNNSSVEQTVVREPQRADMGLRQTLTPGIIGAGGLLTCSLVIRNDGPNDADNATMSAQFQGVPVLIQSATATSGACVVDQYHVSYSVSSLAAGDSVTVHVALVPSAPGTLASSAYVGSSAEDLNYSNNSSYVTLTVLPSARKLLDDLAALVRSYQLRQGPERTLLSSLEDAIAAVGAADSSGACASIADFRRRVGHQAGRQLTLSQAIRLDQDAASVESVLGCGAGGSASARAAGFHAPEAPVFSFRALGGTGAAAAARLDLPTPARAHVEVFDVRGRRVAVLVDRDLQAGSHRISWDGRAASGDRASAGVYFMQARAGGMLGIARIVLLR